MGSRARIVAERTKAELQAAKRAANKVVAERSQPIYCQFKGKASAAALPAAAQ
jgi:hypothetical protein